MFPADSKQQTASSARIRSGNSAKLQDIVSVTEGILSWAFARSMLVAMPTKANAIIADGRTRSDILSVVCGCAGCWWSGMKLRVWWV